MQILRTHGHKQHPWAIAPGTVFEGIVDGVPGVFFRSQSAIVKLDDGRNWVENACVNVKFSVLNYRPVNASLHIN